MVSSPMKSSKVATVPCWSIDPCCFLSTKRPPWSAWSAHCRYFSVPLIILWVLLLLWLLNDTAARLLTSCRMPSWTLGRGVVLNGIHWELLQHAPAHAGEAAFVVCQDQETPNVFSSAKRNRNMRHASPTYRVWRQASGPAIRQHWGCSWTIPSQKIFEPFWTSFRCN